MAPAQPGHRGNYPQPATYIGAYADRGGTINTGNAIGAQYNNGDSQGRRLRKSTESRQDSVDVGILTVLAQESNAVVEVLMRHRTYRSQQLSGGPQVHSASVDAEGGELRVVAVQTLDRGPLSAAVAYNQMRDRFRPPVVLLVGIAGGIAAHLAVGDVVIADEIIYYDPRRETPDGLRHRGRSQPMAPVLRHRLNEFFRRHDGWIAMPPNDDIRLHRGPIGSGDAVITDAKSATIAFLRDFNEKTLVVETEASGVGQAFYEQIDHEASLKGWLAIRGISDLVDRHMSHARHRFAARRAAHVMDHLLPLLKLTDRR